MRISSKTSILLPPVFVLAVFRICFGQQMTATLTPTFLRYGKTLNVVFTLERPCPLTDNLVLISKNDVDSEMRYWREKKTSDTGSKTESYFTRPNSSAVSIDDVTWGHAGVFNADCWQTGEKFSYSSVKLVIPVAPQVLQVNVLDTNKKSYAKPGTPTTSSDNYQSYYEFVAFFDGETGLAKLQIDVGDGKNSDNQVGKLQLSGDTGIIGQNMLSNVLGKEPDYPNGTIYSYMTNATKWSELPEPKCIANITARTEISSSKDLWHQANILLELQYKAQLLRATATTAKSTTCEIACEVNSACPYVDVSLALELYDEQNVSLGRNSVITSRNNRVAISVLHLDTCRTLIALAKNKAGLAVCYVTNVVGTKTQYWKMSEIANLDGLLLSDDNFQFNWWEILLIVLSCVFFVTILAFIIGCIVYKKENSSPSPDEKHQQQVQMQQRHQNDQSTDRQTGGPVLLPATSFHSQQQIDYQKQAPIVTFQQQGRPVSQSGSSFYDGGHATGEYDSPYTQLPADSDYRTVQFANTPRSRQPIVAGPPPPAPETSYDNPAFMRTPAQQRSFREAFV